MESDYNFKILLLGDSHVGKTCLLIKYTDDIFHDYYTTTIGVDFRIKTLQVDGKIIKLRIWDTAGHEKFMSITKAYYTGADGAIIVYDITDKPSFDNIPKWMDEIDLLSQKDFVYKLLIGNKTDLDRRRAVEFSTAKEFANEAGIAFMETSAKSGGNISDVFFKMAEELKKHKDTSYQDIPLEPKLDIRNTDQINKAKDKCICK